LKQTKHLQREIATRDAFLRRLSTGLDLRVAALGDCGCPGLNALQGFAREIAIIAGRDEFAVPRRAKIDLSLLVERVVMRFRKRFRGPDGGQVEIRLTREGTLHGRVDADQLSTVVAELLSNACKYGAGKPVTVALRERSDRIAIVVCDEGAGLPRNERLGKRFVRGTESSDLPGFGVGLWLTRRLAHAHGGTFTLQRRKSGGTRAIVELPKRAPRLQTA
jgi:signal transduction histidine kinase